MNDGNHGSLVLKDTVHAMNKPKCDTQTQQKNNNNNIRMWPYVWHLMCHMHLHNWRKISWSQKPPCLLNSLDTRAKKTLYWLNGVGMLFVGELNVDVFGSNDWKYNCWKKNSLR